MGFPGKQNNYLLNIDKLVKNQKIPVFVIPAKAGIQETQPLVDSRFRGSDGLGDFLRDHQHYFQQAKDMPRVVLDIGF